MNSLSKNMKHLFIDTNSYLEIYRNSDDKHIILNELIKLVNENKIKLYVTKQVIDEFYRNRESVLNISLTNLKNSTIKINIPTFCLNNRDIKRIMTLREDIQKRITKAYNKLKEDAKNERLDMDLLFKKLIKFVDIIDFNDEILSLAKKRYELGNPPRKNKENNARNSYGDGINWEILLRDVPSRNNFFIISNDGDFVSELSEDEISNFLKKEWKEKKKSQIKKYKSISRFLKEEFQNKKITKEIINNEEAKTISFNNEKLFSLPISDSFLGSSTAISFGLDRALLNPLSLDSEVFKYNHEGTLLSNNIISCHQCKNLFQKKDFGPQFCTVCGYINL